MVDISVLDGQMDVHEETLLYDFTDLVADSGGLMGLLLGASVLSLYDLFQDRIKTMTKKCKHWIV